ncbi:hypothetical protein TNIN_163861 [Trichonephila inaurata madagascariensis]|uniref:Uncharacterized protein n=1 Tax=Trichonephila inaurata madagascariensis TaxID=2747483 RepID=A0A8X6XTV8_9ARAC|nr:hypothetical protein TNIN_163861 [Trichonephila inaurata madagascariensis]
MLGNTRIRTTVTLLQMVWLNRPYRTLTASVSRYKMDRVATSGPLGLRKRASGPQSILLEMVLKNHCASRKNSLNLQVRPQRIPPSFLRLREHSGLLSQLLLPRHSSTSSSKQPPKSSHAF